jgi:hypothetical protein
MTAVVVTHAVGSIDTWLKGGTNWKEVFPKFCSSYRIFRHPDDANRVSIVCENVDLAKMKTTMDTAETNTVKAKDTVIGRLMSIASLKELNPTTYLFSCQLGITWDSI